MGVLNAVLSSDIVCALCHVLNLLPSKLSGCQVILSSAYKLSGCQVILSSVYMAKTWFGYLLYPHGICKQNYPQSVLL